MKKSLSGTRLKTAGALLFALCCSTIIVYSTSNIPLLERSITNDLIQGNNCVAQILLFAVMYALRAAFKLIRNHTCAYAGNTVVNQLREYTLEKLIEGRRKQTSTYEYTVLTNDLPVIADLLSSQTFDNISLNRGISKEDVQNYINELNVARYFAHMQNGLDTVITDLGKSLSTSQKAIISLLRAGCMRPSVILLDEIMANISNECKSDINAALHCIARQCIVILIVHDLDALYDVGDYHVIRIG